MTWRLLPGTGGSWSYLGSDGGGGIVGGGPSPGVGPYVLKAGDTMSGDLVSSANISCNIMAPAQAGVSNYLAIRQYGAYFHPKLHVYHEDWGLPAPLNAPGSVDAAVISRFNSGNLTTDFGSASVPGGVGYGTWLQSRIASNLQPVRMLLNPNGGGVGIGVTTSSGQALDVGGNLFLTASAARIYADTSAATNASRFAFQNSVANGNSVFALIPNGTATISAFRAFDNANPDAACAHFTMTAGAAGAGAGVGLLSTGAVAGGTAGRIEMQPAGVSRTRFHPADTATAPGVDITGGVLANRYSERLQSIGPAANAAVTIDWNAGSTVYLAVNGANTINHVNHTGANVMFHFLMIECAGNFNTLVWPGVAWSGGTKPSIAGSAIVSLMCRDGSYIFGNVIWRQV